MFALTYQGITCVYQVMEVEDQCEMIDAEVFMDLLGRVTLARRMLCYCRIRRGGL